MTSSPACPLIYDFSKYVDYIFQNNPTRISRVDVEYATYFTDNPTRLFAGVHQHLGIRTHFPVRWLQRALRHIHAEWNEGASEALLPQVEAWLVAPSREITCISSRRNGRAFRKALRFGMTWPWHTAWRRFPANSVYFNTAYAGLDLPRHLSWLDRRPDIRAVFMIHDLMPLDHPGWFWKGVEETFPVKMRRLIKRADMVIVPSAVVQQRVAAFAAEHRRPDLKIEAVATPPAREFLAPITAQARSGVPYFVICGTIEPRKNHVLLIDLWQRLVVASGPVPRLLVIGGRGWRNADVLAGLASDPLRGYVLEVSGLATVDLVRLIAGAAGLLMPSRDEGYGLPIVEALALGVPVIASDIPVFREIAQGAACFVRLDDHEAWLARIRRLAFDPTTQAEARQKAKRFVTPDWETYCASVMALIDSAFDHPLTTSALSGGGNGGC